MAPAAKMESGVTSTTTSVMVRLMESINASVPTMVITPVKSWVKPCSRPSPTWSTSLTTRLIRSPWAWLSIKLSGMRLSLSLASTRISRTVS